MPFYYKNKKLSRLRKYKNLRIRNFEFIDKIIKRYILPKVRSFGSFNNYPEIYIANNLKKIINDESCLLEMCNERFGNISIEGLNILEVELWLDNISKNKNEESILVPGVSKDFPD